VQPRSPLVEVEGVKWDKRSTEPAEDYIIIIIIIIIKDKKLYYELLASQGLR